MFSRSKNLFLLTKYVKTACTALRIKNKLDILECSHCRHVLVQPYNKTLVKSFSSNSSSEINVPITENSGCLSEDHESTNLLSYDLNDITKGDKEREHTLKVLMLETEVFRQEGRSVPSEDFLKPEHWQNLLNIPSRGGRMKYLDFLFRVSKKKENQMEKKLKKRKEYEAFSSNIEPKKHLPVEEHAMRYGLLYNNIFIRIQDATMNHFYNKRLIQAMQFGQKLVIDCGYDQDMTRRENNNAAKQLMLLFSENRNNIDPFDIHYANMNRQGELAKMLQKYIPTIHDPDFPMNLHEKSYLDLFPKQNLVYLTPHCREVMDTYDHDAVYIIGAIVDKVNNDPLSLAKAKREGIKMQKFPLDKYLQWGAGSGKSLTLNQCVAILLDLKATGDWKYALRHVPRRKLVDPRMRFEDKFKSIRDRDIPKSFSKKIDKVYESAWKPRGFISVR